MRRERRGGGRGVVEGEVWWRERCGGGRGRGVVEGASPSTACARIKARTYATLIVSYGGNFFFPALVNALGTSHQGGSTPHGQNEFRDDRKG